MGSISLLDLRPPVAADRVQDGRPAGFLPSRTADASDALLVARCRRADRDAWAELVQRLSRYVRAIAAGYGLGPSDVEDVGQEVFARVFEQLAELRDDAAIRPWVGQITRRLALDRLRAGARERVAEGPGATSEPAAVDRVLAGIEDATAVRDALATLSDDYREALDRFFARDQSYRVIAEAMSIPMGTVASRISRGLACLRAELEGCR